MCTEMETVPLLFYGVYLGPVCTDVYGDGNGTTAIGDWVFCNLRIFICVGGEFWGKVHPDACFPSECSCP